MLLLLLSLGFSGKRKGTRNWKQNGLLFSFFFFIKITKNKEKSEIFFFF